MFNPVYYCVLSFNKKFLMKAKKVSGIKTKYLITTSEEHGNSNSLAGEEIIGVLKSNFLGTQFNLFDKKKASNTKTERAESKILITINYVTFCVTPRYLTFFCVIHPSVLIFLFLQ